MIVVGLRLCEGRVGLRNHTVTNPVGLVGCCVSLLLLFGCVSQQVADEAHRRINYGMSTSELAVARRVAAEQALREGATVTARAAVVQPPRTASAAGRSAPCTSGRRLLYITLAGQFPRTPKLTNPDGTKSGPVVGQYLTVDAGTGRICDAHYVTHPILSDPSTVLLFSM